MQLQNLALRNYMLLKECCWFVHLASELWIKAVIEPMCNVCCVSKKYDYISLYLNDNNAQIH